MVHPARTAGWAHRHRLHRGAQEHGIDGGAAFSRTFRRRLPAFNELLASPDISAGKRAAIESQLAEFRSSRSHALSPEEWCAMAAHLMVGLTPAWRGSNVGG